MGRWLVQISLKIPLRNMKMAPTDLSLFEQILLVISKIMQILSTQAPILKVFSISRTLFSSQKISSTLETKYHLNSNNLKPRFLKNILKSTLCPNVFTTPIMAMGCLQWLPLNVVPLKGKYCRKPHC